MVAAVRRHARLIVPARDAVRIYLPGPMRARVETGNHRFLNHLLAVLREAGLGVAFHGKSLADQFGAAHLEGLALFHRAKPAHVEALVFRENYCAPFWQIADTAQRWDWPVAKTAYDATEIDGKRAAHFAQSLRKRLFGARLTRDDGYVYIPLQGRLLQRRSFQAASPLEMMEAVLTHDPDRQVIAALHPGETYNTLEREELGKLVARYDRLTLSETPMEALLAGCSYVVSENSSVALKGFILGKPAVLFAQIDFHHIAAKPAEMGVAEAIRMALHTPPDYAAYLFWFFQRHSINAARPNAQARIRNRLRSYGWPV